MSKTHEVSPKGVHYPPHYHIGTHRSQTRYFPAYKHGGLNISHPRFPQEDIPRGVPGENIHQNILIIIIQVCQHTLTKEFHLIFIQELHQKKFVGVYIALLLQHMNLV